jgi:hypothetical protein
MPVAAACGGRQTGPMGRIGWGMMDKIERCALCRNPAFEESQVISFPMFDAAEDHPLARYAGTTIHTRCVLDWPQGPDLLRLTANYLASQVEIETAKLEIMRRRRSG